jgi:D-sedoheptulose 7-phosphate isomerase
MSDPAKLLRDTAAVLQETALTQVAAIQRIGELIAQQLRAGNKLLLCGNGGSAAAAQHLAAELLVRLRPTVNRRSYPAIALPMDSSTFTAQANDYGFGQHFARMVEGLGSPGDVLIAFSTSGRSANIVAALICARQRKIATVGFLGATGGPCLPYCDHAVCVPSFVTGRIQDVHSAVGHAVLEIAEDLLLEADAAA